eukprot:c31523_g1_i1.p1 GENE.c31523_g1_i1~~c31523_g1_i1.p1  ORF type:complete len:114 (+),score=33.74 c31523_g1_i1:30-344(+)
MKFLFFITLFFFISLILSQSEFEEIKKMEVQKEEKAFDPYSLIGKRFLQYKGLKEVEGETFTALELPENHRVITPGMAVTKDFDPERINVYLDGENVVVDVDYN